MDKININAVPEEPTPLGGMARTLVNTPELRLVILKVAAGEMVAEHRAPVKVVFLCINGSGVIFAGENQNRICAGEMITCPAGVLRAIQADKGAGLELLVIRTPNL